MYIDSHAHLSGDALFVKWGELQKRAVDCGIEAVVNICTDETSLERGRSMKGGALPVFLAAATTPHDVEKEGELFFPQVEKAAENKELIAVGETGLDYYYEHSSRDLQKKYLVRYFTLARKHRLPIIFHCREAFADLFSLADVEYNRQPALLHCFTGTMCEAKAVLDRGWYISFSGIITFKKSEALREVARYVPLDRILIETDSPYLAPLSKRGKENEPSFLPETAKILSEIKQESLESIAEHTRKNAHAFFSF